MSLTRTKTRHEARKESETFPLVLLLGSIFVNLGPTEGRRGEHFTHQTEMWWTEFWMRDEGEEVFVLTESTCEYIVQHPSRMPVIVIMIQ